MKRNAVEAQKAESIRTENFHRSVIDFLFSCKKRRMSSTEFVKTEHVRFDAAPEFAVNHDDDVDSDDDVDDNDNDRNVE